MIRFHQVGFTYPDTERPVLSDIDFTVGAGELALVVGATGSGKSTLLRTVNGLVPRFSGGVLSGRVVVAGRDTSEHDVRDMADLVGFVGQDPAAGFVASTVEEELAYTMEQIGLAPQAMRKRVEEVLDLLGLAPLRGRRLSDLSGGEAQRVAIGSVLTAHPAVMVLDEPTSALDPAAAEDVLAIITRLVHDLGITVLMAEHRLERVIQYADSVVYLDGSGGASAGEPRQIMGYSVVAPPVVRLGRLAGWDPLPLSVREARRLAPTLSPRLEEPGVESGPVRRPPLLDVDGLSVRYGSTTAVRSTTLRACEGEIIALMGRNGAGKSSLLWAIQGTGVRSGGRVSVMGRDPTEVPAPEARRLVGLVPQPASDLLFMETVEDECAGADRNGSAAPGTCRRLLERLVEPIGPANHPIDLSEGQRLGLVLAIQLAARPRLVLLDEPTRGLDYEAKSRLTSLLADLAEDGSCVLIATHDVEFVANTAHRVLVMSDGEMVADGPTAEVVVSSPTFAPQVSKVMAPGKWLTVSQVERSLEPA